MKCTAGSLNRKIEGLKHEGINQDEIMDTRDVLVEMLKAKYDKEFFSESEEKYRMGDQYPGANTAYAKMEKDPEVWKRKRREEYYGMLVEQYKEELVGTTVYTNDMEYNVIRSYRVLDVVPSLGSGIGLVHSRGILSVNPETGLVMDTLEAVEGWTSRKQFRDRAEGKIDWKKFTKIPDYKHGSVTDMLAMMDMLHELGGNKESEEHYQYLRGLIGKMKPEFFNKMQMYVQENADKSAGILKTGKLGKLGVVVSKMPYEYANQQSEATIYAHEVVHSMIEYAMESQEPEAVNMRRELNHLMDQAVKHTRWQDFLPDAKDSIDAKAEEKAAKKMFDYVFSSEHSKHEFVAHVLTNPLVMKHMKKVKVRDKKGQRTLLEKIGEFFATVLDFVMGKYQFKDYNSNVYDQTLKLSMRLGEINDRAVKKAKNKNMLEVAFEKLNDIDELAGEALDGVINKWIVSEGSMSPRPEGGVALLKWRMEAMAKMLTNPTYQKYGKLVLSSIGLKPWGMLQNTLSDFGNADMLEQNVHWMGLAASGIDAARMSIIGAVKKAVYDRFKEQPTAEEERAMTRALLDTDVASIFGKGGYKQIADVRKLLEDDEYLGKQIRRAKHRLKELDKDNANWHINQASGLGYYMATHKANIAQNLNAVNIARGLLSDTYKKPTKELIDAIDEVATLVALEHTGRREKRLTADVMKRSSDGVKNILRMHQNFNTEAKKTLFDGSTTHMVKGYSKEVFDDQRSLEVAPISEKAEMEKRGYKLVTTLDKTDQDTYTGDVGLYLSTSFSVSEYQQQAVRLTALSGKGTKIKDVIAATESELAKEKADLIKVKLDIERRKIVKAMYAGEYDVTQVESGMAPVMDVDGNVTDYRYMINKENKEELLNQDVTVAEVLGRSYGHSIDKAQSLEHNDKVLDIILADMKENFTPGSKLGNNGVEYVMIGPKVYDKKMRELYQLLPAKFQEAIHARADKQIAVRADLLLAYFGFRQLSLANALPGLTPTVLKTVIRIAEAIWSEMVKIYKTNILMKMPAVIIGNLISNILYGITTVTGPKEIISLYKDSFRDVREYVRKHRELSLLKVQKNTGGRIANIEARIKLLEKQLAGNPVHELMQLGLYTAIQEDVETAELRNANKVKRKIDSFIKPLPGVIKTPLQWAYLSEETAYYKMMQEALQISDLIARDVQNRKMKIKEAKILSGERRLPKEMKNALVDYAMAHDKKFIKDKGVVDFLNDNNATIKELPLFLKDHKRAIAKLAESARHYALLEMFINYNKPTSSTEEYLNRMGIILFAKFTKRIQKIIGQTARQHPLKSLLMILSQSYMYDLDNIQKQAFFVKDLSVLLHTPKDVAVSLVTPAIFKESTYRIF